MPELGFYVLLVASNLWQVLKAFNLFRLLENEEMEMFSMGGKMKEKQT